MIRNYIKIALRNLKKHKQFSFINIVGLSIALAVATDMLLYITDELSYDRFHPGADRLYRISMKTQFAEKEFHSAWTPLFIGKRIASDFPEVENYATLYKHFKGFALKKGNEEIPVSSVYYSSPNFFDVFGFELKYGDPNSALKDPNGIVLSEQLVEKLFPGEQLMGKILETTDGPRKVTGILAGPTNNSHFNPQAITSFLGHWDIQDLSSSVNFDATFYNYIRLSPGSSSSAFTKKINTEAGTYFKEWINADESRKSDFSDQSFEFQTQSVPDIHLNSHLEFEMEANGKASTVYIFSLVAVLILIVASINYMNLASACYLERLKELGIRKVLGSRRSQLAIQYFTESLVITIFATLLAGIIVQFSLPFFNHLSGKSIDLSSLISLKSIVALVVIVFGTAFLSSFYPAVFISNIKPVRIFNLNSPGIGQGSRFRKGMLVLQIAASGILLIFTSIVFQQLQFMQNYELGFQKDQVVVIEIKGRESRSKIPILKNELLKLSSVKSIGLTGQIPGGENIKTEPMGFESNEGDLYEMLTNYMFSGPDLVDALELKIIDGANFNPEKGGANRGQEVLVNESLVREMNWKDPIGKKVKLPIGDAKVVGVIHDFHLRSLHHTIQPLTIIYLDNWAEALLVKTASENIERTMGSVEKVYDEIVGGSVFEYTFLDDRFAIQYEADKQKAQVFMLFSCLTIIIATMGLTGLIGFSLVRRSKEISIRRVFGASSMKIIRLLSQEYWYVVLIGLLIAVPVANYLIKDWLVNFPYKVDLSIIYFGIPVLSLILLTGLIITVRTYSVSKTNPVKNLRDE